jgi:hypothetical protein|nr:MAG TPA: hypothetical protein [Caudoviricetes sp.]
MSKKIDTKNFDKQKMIEWRKRVGVGPLMWATTIDNANDKISKLTAEKKEKEAYDVKIDVERRLCIVDTNAILAMSKSSLEYDRKLAKKKANYVFVDLIRLATSEFETPAEMDNSGLKTLYSNYKAIKSIQKEHENSIIPKMKKLVEVLFYLGTQTECDKNEVALTMADVYRIIEAKVFTGLTITEGKTEEEKKAIYEAPDVQHHLEFLNKDYADEPFDIYMDEKGHFKTTLEISKLINLALYLVREGLITLEDIQSGIEGLASQFIFIWNGYDLANTVDIAHAILEGQIKILDLSKENFNVEGVDTNIQSIKDADTLLKLLDTAQKYIVNDLRKETLTPILRRFKKFNRNVPVEKDGIDLVTPLADTFDGYLDTYIKIAVPSIKELHDRIVCNYGDKVEMEEKVYNDKGEEEIKKISKVKLNTKMCIASIITLLFIDRLLHIPDFLRGIEVIFSGFLDLTSLTWEAFAKKLDEVISAIDFNVDEAIVEEYEKLANIKIKDYSQDEVKEAVTETIPNTLKEIKEGIENENAKEAVTKAIPNHLKEIDDAIMRGDLKIAPRYVKDDKGNIKFTGADVVTVTDTLKKTVKNTHGEEVPVVSGKCNVAEELDKGNAVEIAENLVIVPQDKSKEY